MCAVKVDCAKLDAVLTNSTIHNRIDDPQACFLGCSLRSSDRMAIRRGSGIGQLYARSEYLRQDRRLFVSADVTLHS
jgi:hypothetical protein